MKPGKQLKSHRLFFAGTGLRRATQCVITNCMEAKFRALLPTNILALADEIESYTHRTIEVARNPYPRSLTDPNPDSLGAMVDEHSAVIYFYQEADFKPHPACHELLHIRRYRIEKVPQILAIQPDADRMSVTSHIENTLEHLVIVPREQDYGFEPYSHWNHTADKNWETYPWPTMTNSWARRKNSLLGWLTVKYLVNDSAVKQRALEAIKKEGLFQEAEVLANQVGRVLGNKAKMISLVVKALKIPMREAELVFFDPQTGTRAKSRIPLY
jgi:hypothetical protein